MAWLERFAQPIYAVLRIVTGLLFFCHGGQKVFGLFGGHGPATTLMTVAGWIEVVTGILIAIGLFTGIAAFIASGQMAVAYFMVHAPGGALPIVNKGELAVVYCFLFLYFAAVGGGPWSVDAMMKAKR
jgi:putative oxidoreductase